MKIAVISFTKHGYELGKKIEEILTGSHDQVTLAVKCRALSGKTEISEVTEESLRSWTKRQFSEQEAIIFVGAVGIAVRAIAPFVQTKVQDPAVLVVDEQGKYCIPILSGHLGGANALANELSEALKAIPVITTATDLRGKWAVDVFAKKNDLVISDMKKAKDISARILVGEQIRIWMEEGITIRSGKIPEELQIFRENEKREKTQDSGKYDIVIGTKRRKGAEDCLYLIPKTLILGIGCKKDTPSEMIEKPVKKVLEESRIFPESIQKIASIDLKRQEAGILELCGKYQCPFETFSADTLNRVQGEFSGSEFVKQTTGVDNVCERSAVCASKGGRLLVKKQAASGVTVAIAIEERGINFE